MTEKHTNGSAAAVTPGEENAKAATGPAKLTEFPKLATQVEAIHEELESPGQECPQDLPGTAPGWIDTPSAQRVFSALACAQDLGEITVIHGGTGVGKTAAARRYADTFEAVWFAEMNSATNSLRACLERVAIACRATHCGHGGANRIWTAIADRLRGICVFGGTRGLLVIDEAQHLGHAQLEALRGLHDETGCGLALLGNDRFGNRIERPEFAALASRVGDRVHLPRVTAGDVDALLAARGIEGAKARERARLLAAPPAGLRGLARALRNETLGDGKTGRRGKSRGSRGGAA